MKPVEIEFLMKDSLSAGLDKAGESVRTLTDRARAAAELISAKIRDQHRTIDGVAADLERMERQLAGMEPGTAQRDLAADAAACRKVLEEERAALQELEAQHRKAEEAVNALAREHEGLAASEGKAAMSQKELKDRIAESRELIRGTQADVKELEKAYRNAAPGNAQNAVLAELNAAKKALEEEKAILASLTAEQERNKESCRRLSVQLRELQDAMAKMRMEGRQDSEEYRRMATEAANLSDTIGDLRAQTNILSNDDANLQGLMSGVSGLSGAFAAATGALSLFASENENLAKIQTRVQGVMAVTMGLQQVMNTLNKDSAFRLVTVAKMKDLLTAANTRLAASLHISNAAAKALTGTLTLGLSAAVTGLIYLWDRYGDAQEKAAEAARAQLETEAQGRAQMLKARLEIDETARSLKEFSGTKEDEKIRVEELNRKYGESLGYYDTVAEWYDTLTQKGEAYVGTLFLQAKAQAMVNKAVELDQKVAEAEAKPAHKAKGARGAAYRGMAMMGAAMSGGTISAADVNREVDEYNAAAKAREVEEAKAERDGYLRQVEELYRQADKIREESGIGRHRRPGIPKQGGNDGQQKEHEREMADERRRAGELERLRRENMQADIDLMEEGSRKRMRQMELDHERETAAIKALEDKWREAQAGTLTESQADELANAYSLADAKYMRGKAAMQEEQREAEEQAMREYLARYGEYEERRLAIAEGYEARIARAKTEGESLSLQKEMEKALAGLDLEELKDGLDWEAVFGDLDKVSAEGLESLKERLKEYIGTQKGLQPESLKELAAAVEAIRGELNGRDPFGALRGSMGALGDATLQVREAQEAYNRALERGTDMEKAASKAALDAARNARQQALAEATDALQSSIGKMKEYTDMAEGLTGLAEQTGIDPPEWLGEYLEGAGQVLDGLAEIDLTRPMSAVTGGIKALSGAVKQMVSLGGLVNWNGSNAKEVQDTMERLADRNELLRTSIEDLTDEMKSARGAQAIEASNRARKMQEETNANYMAMAQAQAGYHGSHKSWNYYWKGFSEEQKERLSGQMGREWDGSLWSLTPEEMKLLRSNVDMWEQIRDTGKGGYGEKLAEQLDAYIEQAGKLEEITDSLFETLTTTTRENVFDGFLESLYGLADGSGDVMDSIADDWQKMVNRMAVNNLVGAKFRERLEGWYEELGMLNEERTTGAMTDAEYKARLDALKDEYDRYVQGAKDDIEALRQEGIIKSTEDGSGGTRQSAKAGGFTAMTQDQGTKLEGMFTSGLRHWSSMDEKMENVAEKMNAAEGHLARIEANTGRSAGILEAIAENMVKIIRDGVRVK